MSRLLAVAVLAVAVSSTGCAGLASGYMADALSTGTTSSFARDDDPELVAAASPFGLKTMEAVLDSQPQHVGLLTALCSGYVSYAYAFVSEQAHAIEDDDYAAAQALKVRAKRLYLRARDYGLRGLSVDHPDFETRLRADAQAVLAEMTPADVPLLYWTASAWSLGISAAGLDPALVADLPLAGQIAGRALVLDEAWNDGALHDFMVSFEAGRPGGDLSAAADHFERAVQLNGGRRAGSYLGYAEVARKQQDVKLFRSLIDKALAVDVDAHPDDRLVNVIMQRRARRLLARIDDLFLDADEEDDQTEDSP